MVSKFKVEERRRLINVIQEWNLNRLDLFALSEPNENLEFFGVMRFFYQDDGEKVSTKCIRVSSTATTSDVIEILVEKFRPDMRMLTRASYSLYEVHVNGDERKLMEQERPLLLQLNWGKDDREGRFLLRKEVERSSSLGRLSSSTSELSTTGKDGGLLNRKLSKREKKELKKKEKEEKMRLLASRGSEVETNGQGTKSGVAEKLYSELPESSFTRSISNPELVMRKRRQLKLERKLQEMSAPDGTQGGTLKIYGHSIKPDVPYKTLLLSVNDTVAQVVAESLEKYGYEQEDPDHFCLVLVMIPPEGSENNKDVRERVMDDDECPLNILLQHPPSKGLIKFHLRLRPPDAQKRAQRRPPTDQQRPNKSFDSVHSLDSWPNNAEVQQTSFLLPVGPDGRELMNTEKIPVPFGMLEVGRERSRTSNVPFFCLASSDILPQHCSITRSAGGMTWIAPANQEAAVFIQNQRVREPTQIQNGQVVQIGRNYFFRYLENRVPSAIQNSNYVNNNNTNNNHLRSPSSSSSSRASTSRPSKDFETTFDLDGQVLTVPSHSLGPIGSKAGGAFNQEVYAKNAHNPVLSPSAQHQFKPSLLPAHFALSEGGEDRFLRECVTEVNFAVMQFKMSPSFLVYLATRSMLRSPASSSSTTDGDMKIPTFAARMSQLIAKSVKENTGNPPLLSFWLANASELKNFFTFDPQLSRLTEQAQLTLMDIIQVAFSSFVDCLKGELEQTLQAILGPGPEAGDMEVVEDFVIKRVQPKLGNVTHVLTLAMSVLRRCRVNTTMTIFIFSQLFGFISSWVFNYVVLDPRLRLCSSDWGRRIRLRMQQILMWSEKQGLEKAAECHLSKAMQLCLILECRKPDIFQVLPKCDLINSVQLQAILVNFIYTQEEQPLTREQVDRAVRIAASTVDYDIMGEGGAPQLPEPLDQYFQVSQVFPREGFSCDSVIGVPPGMMDFVEGFTRSGIGAFNLNPHSSGSWSIYLDRSQMTEGEESLNMVPEVIQVTLTKVRNSLGLSIVAAQAEGQREKGIYVRSVVPSGAADLDGRIQKGDQLVEVGGRSLIGVTQEKAAEMMSQSGQVVNLKVLKRAALCHGLSALLESALPDASLQRQQKAPIVDEGRSRIQNPARFSDDVPSSSPVPKHPVNPDSSYRSQSSLPWRQEASSSSALKEDPYGRLPYNVSQAPPSKVNAFFPAGMTSSHSNPNLINPEDSYHDLSAGLKMHSGPKKFDTEPSSFEGSSEFKYGQVPNVGEQLRNSSSAQMSNYSMSSSSDVGAYQNKRDPTYASLNQNNQLTSNGRQDSTYGKLGQARSNSPMSLTGSVHFSDAPPIKFNPALMANRAPRPSSAIIPLGKGPGYATQMLFPKATVPPPNAQLPPNVRASSAIFPQSNLMPPTSSNSLSSQNKGFSSMSSNSDYLINSANQSSEIYQNRAQVLPKNQLNSSAEYDFPPPPPEVQLAQMKISVSTPGQPRPFETLQPSAYEGSQLKSIQNEIQVSPTDVANQKKPPPVAAKPKITPSDLKSVTLSKSPWEKEAREKEEEEMMKRKRKDEIRRLESRPYLSQEEQTKLKRLQTEEEFDQRALQASQESQDMDTPTRIFMPNFNNLGFQEQSNSFYPRDNEKQPQYHGQVRPNQSQFEPLRPSASQYNSFGYGQQEEQQINMQGSYDPYRSREEMQAQALQMSKVYSGSALKQLQQSDNLSQSSLNTTGSSGMTKKTVTFNENVGVNEYPVLRSYGSTSSDGSLVQSFDQSFGGNYSDDQSPNSSLQRGAIQPTFLPKLVDQDRAVFNIPASQVSFEYKPKFNPEPLYASRPTNPTTSYPYRPPQLNPVPQSQQQQATYPYKPPLDAPNPRLPASANVVYGRRQMDPTYAQRAYRTGSPSVQENPYVARTKALYGMKDANYSYE